MFYNSQIASTSLHHLPDEIIADLVLITDDPADVQRTCFASKAVIRSLVNAGKARELASLLDRDAKLDLEAHTRVFQEEFLDPYVEHLRQLKEQEDAAVEGFWAYIPESNRSPALEANLRQVFKMHCNLPDDAVDPRDIHDIWSRLIGLNAVRVTLGEWLPGFKGASGFFLMLPSDLDFMCWVFGWNKDYIAYTDAFDMDARCNAYISEFFE